MQPLALLIVTGERSLMSRLYCTYTAPAVHGGCGMKCHFPVSVFVQIVFCCCFVCACVRVCVCVCVCVCYIYLFLNPDLCFPPPPLLFRHPCAPPTRYAQVVGDHFLVTDNSSDHKLKQQPSDTPTAADSKHWFTTPFLWRKVPESDAQSAPLLLCGCANSCHRNFLTNLNSDVSLTGNHGSALVLQQRLRPEKKVSGSEKF